jgi:hypothetical protein
MLTGTGCSLVGGGVKRASWTTSLSAVMLASALLVVPKSSPRNIAAV